MINVTADVMICNCSVLGGRETAELSRRQIMAENIKRNRKVLLPAVERKIDDHI